MFGMFGMFTMLRHASNSDDSNAFSGLEFFVVNMYFSQKTLKQFPVSVFVRRGTVRWGTVRQGTVRIGIIRSGNCPGVGKNTKVKLVFV